MQALVISDDDALAARIGKIITGSGLGYRVVDIVPFGSAGVANGPYDVTVVNMPKSNPEHGVEIIRTLSSTADSLVLAVGPTDDAKLVLYAFRHGASEYIDLNDLDTELQASLTRFRARQLAKVKGGRIIGLLSASGGCGVSTLAANLAILLTQGGGHCVLVEMRTPAADQAVLLDLKPSHTLVDLCRNVDRLDENMFQQALAQHSSGMALLAASSSLDDAAQVTPQGVIAVLGLARTLFPYVIVDLDRSLRAEQMAAMSQADLLLLVLRLDMASLGNTKNMLHYLKGCGIAENRIQGIANRAGQSKELPIHKVEQALGIPIAYQIPDDAARMNLAGNEGIPVAVQQPWAKVSRSLAKLATDLRERKELYRSSDVLDAVAEAGQGAAPRVVAGGT